MLSYAKILILSFFFVALNIGIVATTTANFRSQLNCVIGVKVKREMQDMETLQRNQELDMMVE
jgi:hypothetical protein